ncbi:hypothetical protein ACFOWE_29065 [Planomonospora corallina]|uniref:RNA polymerase alpha subunit C-terminal domain-containing protein n=1 Tax=Planomonospora corallina TaxID=1806052 RepID=A0ABV8IKM8_9ACTN
MGGELFFRTEDIRQDEILGYLVETPTDRDLIEQLKGRSPVILKGSRGVGKSFLMRAAEAEIKNNFTSRRILPVYVTFARAGLIRANAPDKFLLWMMAKICNSIIRAASSAGLTLPGGSTIAAIRGGGSPGTPSKMEVVEKIFEDSWKNSGEAPLPAIVPDPEVLKDAVEDLCLHANLNRIILFVDEAAHVFIPEQQRQFFTLMRDLRSPYLSIKAAVYPGATSYGDSFQPIHDATVLIVDRSVTDHEYAAGMREIVFKQDPDLRKIIEQNGEVFDTLAYAATGNPRILLKTLDRSKPFNRRNAQEVIRQYYREDIWSEHSGLTERYPGHRDLIDWGRQFIEGHVLPKLYETNKGRKSETQSHFWIHRDAPQSIKEALRLLCYSGILQEGVSGIRATRSEVGTRYMVNLGCLFSLDAEPVSFGAKIRQHLSIKRFPEFGANHSAYRPISKLSLENISTGGNQALESQLQKSSDLLDITEWQKQRIRDLGLSTIGEVLAASEEEFMKAHYVGPKRARKVSNAAIAAVLEYLSG